MTYKELDDYKYIKKDYGENMAKLCRSLFPTILEKPGLLYYILTQNFAKNRSLYDDIVREHKEFVFKEYIYHFVDNEVHRESFSGKTVRELLEEAGYDLYVCKDNDDVLSFEKYYQPGEELCTFSDPLRIENYYIFFIVKKNVDEIRREDFPNPRREDEYSISVLDLQFDKGKTQRVSIKSRYNHTVANPDATFSNNLDSIIPGLTEAFCREYGFNISTSAYLSFELDHYVQARDEKIYKYNYEIHNVHYCPDNIIIDNGNVIDKYRDRSRYTFMDYFILDEQEKKIIVYDKRISDSFINGLDNITKIEINNKDGYKEVILTLDKDKTAIIKLDKYNRIIGYENENIEKIGHKFLKYNETMKELKLPNLQECGSYFMFSNKELEELNLPKLKKCGVCFLHRNQVLSALNLPQLVECEEDFLTYNRNLEKLSLPELKRCGDQFLFSNDKITELDLPKLERCGAYFFQNNTTLSELSLPSLEVCGSQFLYNNSQISSVYLPKLKRCGSAFLQNAVSLKRLSLPSLIQCGQCFLMNNKSLVELDLPNLEECGRYFLESNRGLKELNLPKLRTCGRNFLSHNTDISKLHLPSLEKCGEYFMASNIYLRELRLPNLREIEQGFFKSNKSIKELYLPNVVTCKGRVLDSHPVLQAASIHQLKKIWYGKLIYRIKSVIRNGETIEDMNKAKKGGKK